MVKQSLVKIVLGVLVKDRVARVDADLEQLISGQTPLPLSLLSDSAFLRAVALMPLFLAALSAILAQYGAERHEARGPPQALRCALAASKHTEPRAGSKAARSPSHKHNANHANVSHGFARKLEKMF